MTKVITYGTYDLLHYGHIRLLERAKALGDYLIVGVTSDDFDKSRGKINVQQSLMERIEAVRATGIADEIIIEEYEGQKIDDIKRYDIDIFTVGSDWVGKFDYLSEYCEVKYLERTEGISSSAIRSEIKPLRIGLICDTDLLIKYYKESQFVNGVTVSAVYTRDEEIRDKFLTAYPTQNVVADFNELFEECDAVYVASHPRHHKADIMAAILAGKHVLCESPITVDVEETKELFELAKENNVVMTEALKTAYSMAYSRLLLLIKTGAIGDVCSVDVTCTSLSDVNVRDGKYSKSLNSITAWGPTALLPVFQILGTDYKGYNINSILLDKQEMFDGFTKIDMLYESAVATIKVGKAVKSEGELIITGTKGYIYVEDGGYTIVSKLDSFDESKSSISTWIYTITRNTVYDYFRTRRVTDELSDTVPEASDFTERVCTELMLEKLAAVMNRISERERDLISLHYLGGLTLKETADRLDISYSYAKRIHADALQELRRLMEK